MDAVLKRTQNKSVSYFPAGPYVFECRSIRLAYDHTTNSSAHYYPPLSSTSSSQSTMYLIMLLSVTLRCLFGGCYLFAVETPRGGIQPIRDCCSVNSPLTSSGWVWLLFKWVSFVLAPELKLPCDRSPPGEEVLMALLYTAHHAWWSLCSRLNNRKKHSQNDEDCPVDLLIPALNKHRLLRGFKPLEPFHMLCYTHKV